MGTCRRVLRAGATGALPGVLPGLLPGLLLAALLRAPPAGAEPPPEALRAALDAACAGAGEPAPVLAALGGGIHLASETLDGPPQLDAVRHRLLLPDGTRLRLDAHRRDARLLRIILESRVRAGATLLPRYWVVADAGCGVRVARRLVYGERGTAVRLEVLDATLGTVRSSLALDEPVPPGPVPEGVAVAMVDSGVNYTLAPIAARLARRADGTLLGHDYWDDDPRPFDHHPARSPFVPLRHGTRTASLLLADAPVATIAPMRYPRPDMSRMARLVEDAAAAGIVIVNLSLGGPSREQWRAFEAAARARPEMLFIASAGNDGRDLDADPVWPAALALENLITVSSADAQGLPAPGSNWGRRTVDLLVPAEGLVTADFDGYAVEVAGSSYAAVRVSALAACLKAANPGWQAPELRRALFAMARQPVHASSAYVAVGLIESPTLAARGACRAQPAEIARLGRVVLDEHALYPRGAPREAGHVLAPLTLVWIEDAGWPLEWVLEAAAGAAAIYRQCALRFERVEVELLRLPRRLRYYDTPTALDLMRRVAVSTPAAWFVRDTLQQPAFDAEAIGRSNLGARGPLLHTLWLTAHLEHPGIALAHELYHVLADTGGHVPERDNLMHGETSPHSTRLADWQCDRLLRVGKAFELIR